MEIPPGPGCGARRRAHVVKTGVGQTADVPPAVAAKDHDHGFVHNAADSDPLQAVHTGKEVGNGHQQVRALDFAERGVGSAAPAVGERAEGARKERQPGAQIFAAGDPAQQIVVRMVGEPLVSA